MSNLNFSFLDFQYNLSKKNKILRKSSRFFSFRDWQNSPRLLSFRDCRQNSGLLPIFEPNHDEMKKVFEKFDSNKDGKVSQSEYKHILRSLGNEKLDTEALRTLGVGNEKLDEEVQKIFKIVDLDGDGFINFKQFMKVHEKGGGIRTIDIHNAFRMFDLNGDGKISAEEVMEVLRGLGETCNLEDCRRMVRAVDTDGDDMVDIDEFMTMMTRTLRHVIEIQRP